MKEIRCIKCNIIKHRNQYIYKKTVCSSCDDEYRRNYYIENRKRLKDARTNRKDQISIYNQNYYQRNKEEIKLNHKKSYNTATPNQINERAKKRHDYYIRNKQFIEMTYEERLQKEKMRKQESLRKRREYYKKNKRRISRIAQQKRRDTPKKLERYIRPEEIIDENYFILILD